MISTARISSHSISVACTLHPRIILHAVRKAILLTKTTFPNIRSVALLFFALLHNNRNVFSVTARSMGQHLGMSAWIMLVDISRKIVIVRSIYWMSLHGGSIRAWNDISSVKDWFTATMLNGGSVTGSQRGAALQIVGKILKRIEHLHSKITIFYGLAL